jgi:hypothetical protein
VILTPALFEKISRHTMDGYHLEQTVSLLEKHGEIDKRFASLLVKQLLSVCTRKNSDVFHELDGPIKSVFKAMIQTHPAELWVELSQVLVTNGSLEQFYLERLIDHDHDDHLAAGILHSLPKSTYLDWVRKKPSERASIVMDWLPIAKKSDTGGLSWHPDLEAYVAEFGTQPNVLGELSSRMRPSSWWGSLVPHLEPFLPLLALWSKHALAEVRSWAAEQTQYIQNEVTDERKRDEERDVGLY